MYQPCTSTAVNHGEQRSPTVAQTRRLSRPNAALAGTGETFGANPKITRARRSTNRPATCDCRLGAPFSTATARSERGHVVFRLL
jgi:hypothetical protein